MKLRAMSRVLYMVLIQRCPLAFSRLRLLPKGWGFRAWQEVCRKFSPKHPGRFASQLTEILNPDWAHSSGNFMDKHKQWIYQVHEYEREAGEVLSDRTKCAVVLRLARLEVRDVLRRTSAQVLDQFDELVKTLEDYRIRSQTFVHGQIQSTTSPMEVDAIKKGKKKRQRQEERKAYGLSSLWKRRSSSC